MRDKLSNSSKALLYVFILLITGFVIYNVISRFIVDRSRELKNGSVAPEIVIQDIRGNKFELKSLRGKVVMLDFWASWCAPCRIENPRLVKLYEKYKDKDFEIVSISLDSEEHKWKNAVETDKMSWQYHVSELKGWNCSTAQKYGVVAIPAFFLVDKDGIIIEHELSRDELASKLEELLGTP